MPDTNLNVSISEPPDEKADIEEIKREILIKSASGKMDTLQERVCWILNNFPDSRDSDICLQLKYWEKYESDIYAGGAIYPDDLYKLTRLTSISRARAKIQNTYKLFQASSDVRKFRGMLDEDEKVKAKESRGQYPTFVIYADESGKTDKHLIVGSLWVTVGYEAFKLANEIEDWKKAKGIDYEFHFNKITTLTLPIYIELIDFLNTQSHVIGFKALSVERAGIRNIQDAFSALFYHLIIEGVTHEDETRRAPLPRSLQLWKDAEEIGYDKLLIAELKDKISQTAVTRFDSKLHIDLIEFVDSKSLILMQIADLFTGCINRKLNQTDSGNNKDVFANHLLKTFGINGNSLKTDAFGDLVYHKTL